MKDQTGHHLASLSERLKIWPVYSTHGRGGGWQLIGDATTDLTGLSSDEATALFLAAGSGRLAGPQLEAAMKSGLCKLTGALPETFRDEARVAASAIKVDDAGWRDAKSSATENNARFLDQLARAVIDAPPEVLTELRRIAVELHERFIS